MVRGSFSVLTFFTLQSSPAWFGRQWCFGSGRGSLLVPAWLEVCCAVFVLVTVVVVVLAEAQFSWAACDVNQLSPCLSAFTANAPPSTLCCQRLKQQKPCFCQYLKDPTLKQYLSAGKKVATACKVSFPKC
nr:non-specific lipid-transfer protein 2 [Ipomoea trifida]